LHENGHYHLYKRAAICTPVTALSSSARTQHVAFSITEAVTGVIVEAATILKMAAQYQDKILGWDLFDARETNSHSVISAEQQQQKGRMLVLHNNHSKVWLCAAQPRCQTHAAYHTS
jgi:hypothetical protein